MLRIYSIGTLEALHLMAMLVGTVSAYFAGFYLLSSCIIDSEGVEKCTKFCIEVEMAHGGI